MLFKKISALQIPDDIQTDFKKLIDEITSIYQESVAVLRVGATSFLEIKQCSADYNLPDSLEKQLKEEEKKQKSKDETELRYAKKHYQYTSYN